MTLGQKLKRLRTDKNLTQKALADHLHVTFQTVSKWENDENEPDIATLKELAKLYECSLDFLLSEEEIPENVEEEEEVVEDSLPSEEVGVENQNNQAEDNTPQVIVEENKEEVALTTQKHTSIRNAMTSLNMKEPSRKKWIESNTLEKESVVALDGVSSVVLLL